MFLCNKVPLAEVALNIRQAFKWLSELVTDVVYRKVVYRICVQDINSIDYRLQTEDFDERDFSMDTRPD